MTTQDNQAARTTPWELTLSLIICAIAGVSLLVTASFRPLIWGIRIPEPIFDLFHDLGIALIVSAVVGGLFEIYRTARHQLESMRDVIDYVMADKITSEVWMELDYLIEEKCVIRRSVVLRLEVERNSKLQGHEAVLKVDHLYELHSLREKHSKFKIRHELDYQLARPDLGLPYWETIVVTPEEAKTSKEKIDKSNPLLDIEVALQPRRNDAPISVQTRRQELIQLPGSYNFYAPEFMKGIRMSLVGCPPEFEAEVLVRPHGGGEALPNRDNTWSFEHLIFPGQGIEVKFKQRTNQESHSAFFAELASTADPSGQDSKLLQSPDSGPVT
jgi:hypothetical protein